MPEDVTAIRTARSSGSAGSYGTDTEAGALLGTPAYMPPEQANGDIAHLDRRADVFGLGAILCEILTGKPPYVGRSSKEVRRKATNADLADALTPAKLTFACSANYLDHIDALNLTADQHRFLAEIADPMFRQSVRDFIVNQQFRRDYWVKGPRRMSSLEQAEALRRLRVMLLTGPRSEVERQVVCTGAEARDAERLAGEVCR